MVEHSLLEHGAGGDDIPPLNIYIAPTVSPGMMCNLNQALNATVFSLPVCKLDFHAANGYKCENKDGESAKIFCDGALEKLMWLLEQKEMQRWIC